jgi:hypothetical protein
VGLIDAVIVGVGLNDAPKDIDGVVLGEKDGVTEGVA